MLNSCRREGFEPRDAFDPSGFPHRGDKRRRRDSNPPDPFESNGFQDGWLRPGSPLTC